VSGRDGALRRRGYRRAMSLAVGRKRMDKWDSMFLPLPPLTNY